MGVSGEKKGLGPALGRKKREENELTCCFCLYTLAIHSYLPWVVCSTHEVLEAVFIFGGRGGGGGQNCNF